MATLLLAVGAKVNRLGYHPTEQWVRTPVQATAARGDLILLQTLVRAGGNVNAPAHWCNGVTALGAATAAGDSDLIQCLLQCGANVDAVHDDYDGILQSKKFKSTALQMSVRRGNSEAVDLLLKAGANPDFAGEGGDAPTPLQIAATRNLRGIMKQLLDEGADIHARGNGKQHRRSPLHIAAANDHLQAVQMLLRFGADPNGSADSGRFPRTPLLEAVENCHVNIVTVGYPFRTPVDCASLSIFA
jgi:ankyrin repeat protein